MGEHYEPASEFLKAIISNEVPLSGSMFAETNLQRLIAMTRDEDRSNRDWATMLLAQEDIDTPEVREALLTAARDHDEAVRAEALVGLARRDPSLALPFLQGALSASTAMLPVFEAAALVADSSLVEALRGWIEPSADEFLDRAAQEALAACEQERPAS